MRDDQKIIVAELAKQGKYDTEIALILNIGRAIVRKCRKEFGIASQPKPSLPNAEHKLRYALYKQGLSDKALATACNISVSAATSWRKKHLLLSNNKDHPKRKCEKAKQSQPGSCCGSCRFWDPPNPEPIRCKQCGENRELWEKRRL